MSLPAPQNTVPVVADPVHVVADPVPVVVDLNTIPVAVVCNPSVQIRRTASIW